MKKRLASLALAALLLISVPLSAFATSKFNTSVLSGRDNVSISYFDEMTGNVTASLTGDAYNSSVTFDNGALLTVDPTICLNDSFDYYRFNFNCLETAPIGMTSIIIKIGDNRYNFTNCATSLVPLGDNAYWENIYFVLKRETVGFMNDFVKHRDEEIKVRINGTYTTLDFSLTDEMKNEILDLYALYDDGRGTRDANLRDITYTDSTSVYKNGKFIDGLVKEEVIHILAHSF